VPQGESLDEDEPVTDEVTKVPHPARMYDYYLGGKDNFEVDRIAAEKAMTAVPDARRVVQTNREFLVRVVAMMADSGIDQFIDLGTGYPTSPNVHEIARERQPGAQIVYVDNDPVVVNHNRALRERPGVVAIAGDVREPEGILASPALTAAIDFTRPVGVLFFAVLHFVPDALRPAGIVAAFQRRMVPGSMLAISHATGADMADSAVHTVEDAYKSASAPAIFRDPSGIAALFGGWPIMPPGVVEVTKWRPHDLTTSASPSLRIMGGVATVPA
jgi:hypothetical protein